MGFLPDRSKVVLRHILERHAAERPDKECVLFEDGQRWTYKEGLKEAYRAANVLWKQGLKRGENILVFLPNSQGFVRAWWGITSLGAVMIPVNTAYKGEMLRHVCRDSEAKHIITTPDLAERLNTIGLNLNVINPDNLAEGSSNETKLDEPIEPWDIYAILYTSGTTGPSKGAISTYFHIANGGYTDIVRGDDTVLCDLPLFHVGATTLAYAAWMFGGRVAVRGIFTATNYWDVIRETGATMAAMYGTIPAFLENMPPRPDDADNPLRKVNPTPMFRDPAGFKKRFGVETLFVTYGLTEVCCPITGLNPSNPRSCGRVRPGFKVRLVDDHDIPVPTGEPGELIVRADLPWVPLVGYWRRPEATAQAWRNGWFHTGDFHRCDEEGNYYYMERKKDAIRRRGENISSYEVEQEVLAYPGVVEAACVAAPGEFGEDEVKVFVALREGAKFDPEDLIKFLIFRMPYYMVPRYIEVVSEFEKTPSSKIKKFELRKLGNSAATWDREAAGIVVGRNS